MFQVYLTFDSEIVSVICRPVSSKHHKQPVNLIRTHSGKNKDSSLKGSYIPNRRMSERLDLVIEMTERLVLQTVDDSVQGLLTASPIQHIIALSLFIDPSMIIS